MRMALRSAFVTALLFASLLVACSRKESFPTNEDEIRQRIHNGMSSAEIVAAFGQPTSKSSAEDGRVFFYYFSPKLLAKKPTAVHFVGFQVVFKDDKVISWSPTQGT
jgi:outer membrane protein assembly factor BamE (lipoprotein component of BamABCDE complex)